MNEVAQRENAVVEHSTPQSESGAIIAVIERAALNPEVDIDKMERLLQMQERILNRNAQMAFSAALAQMQCDLPSIAENGAIVVNGAVRSKYARFEDINDTVRPILQRHGFAVTFRVKQENGAITVAGILAHREGHSEETSITLPADKSGSKNDVQAIGSTVAYGKRYTMCALLNITSRGEDDDGQGANKPEDPLISPNQISHLLKAAKVAGVDEAYICKKARIESIKDMKASRVKAAMNHLQKLADGEQQQ